MRKNFYLTLFTVSLLVMSAGLDVSAQENGTTFRNPAATGAIDDQLFEGWPKPKLLLLFSGFMNGYVEPCGCAGAENMKGGLSRRLTFIEQLNKKGWPLLAIDGGNLNKGFGRQEELKYSYVIDEALRKMNYQVAGLGNHELLLSANFMLNYTADLLPGEPRRYTSANVALFEFNPDTTVPYRINTSNGLKIGTMSVICASPLKGFTDPDIVTAEAIPKIKEHLPKLDAEKCDKKVLIVHGTAAERDAILNAFPNMFDFVLCSDTQAEPLFRPKMADKTMLIDVGEKGKFMIGVGLFDDSQPARYQRIPLDKRFANSPVITEMMQTYQEQLKEEGLHGLGIKPIPSNRVEKNGKYVGSKSCADCHEPSYNIWRKSKHGNAWNSLVETAKPARQFDPECIACHVVGWNPTELLPYESGFLSEEKTPLLIDVGCESCHGPGENHNKAEQGRDEKLKQELRLAIRLPLANDVARKNCITCHDGDNSPHFHFDTYWPKIVHKE